MNFIGVDRFSKSKTNYLILKKNIFHSKKLSLSKSEQDLGGFLVKKQIPIVRMNFKIIEKFGDILLQDLETENTFRLSKESIISIFSFIENGLFIHNENGFFGIFKIESKYSYLYAEPTVNENIVIKESYDE